MSSIVESVVLQLVQNLDELLVEEVVSLLGVRHEVESLATELRQMQSFLKDAEAKQEGDERVKYWMRDVRDVAYDAEDVIETYLFKEASFRRGVPVLWFNSFIDFNSFFIDLKSVFINFKSVFMNFKSVFINSNSFFINSIVLYTLGLEIKSIKNKIRAISERSSNFGIEDIGQVAGTSSDGLSLQEQRHTSPFFEEPDFVGFKTDLEALVRRLTEGEPRRCVVSVVGMGGLGKTTLTKKVYNDTRVQAHFHSCVWITVSQKYGVRDLLLNILNRHMRLPEDGLNNMDLFELRHEISLYLQKRRYLIVLDDIWAMEEWDALKNAFPDMRNGSRVMLTTRIKDVALHADATSKPHELRLLNKEESWELFCKKTFPGQDGGYPQDLEKLGREIVEKCQGLPLSIIVIGGLLSRKEPGEWKNISKSMSWQLDEGEVRFSGMLYMSYKDLPYFLKLCFLYLGSFPKGYQFRATELIRIWAAEGLIQEKAGEQTVEEVGEDCLKELVQRSMVQVASRSSSGGIKSFRIHEFLRDLSISEAKESKFLEIHSDNANALSTSTARRLAIHHNDLSEYISLSYSTRHLRSVLIYTQGRKLLQREQEMFLYRGFKLLRVLYLHGAYIKNLPIEIGELFLLRYLGCTNTLLESLPSSIANLPHLQTLSVSSFYDMKVPSTILEMQQLRHLQVEDVVKSTYLGLRESWREIEGHPRLDRISNLQTLTCVEAGEWMVDCLGKLTNLRKLGIRLHHERAYDKVLYESIGKMNYLRSLSVVTRFPFPLLVPPPSLSRLPKLMKLRLEGMLEKLPEFTEFPTYLTKLTLAFSYLKKDPLATLERLENLRILRLLGASYTGKEMACAAHGFPSLESLHLEELDQLEQWSVERRAMPRLLHLRIDNCRHLKMLPEGLQYVGTLKNMELWNMHDEFKARVREDEGADRRRVREDEGADRQRVREDEGADRHKIQHIPSIDIRY